QRFARGYRQAIRPATEPRLDGGGARLLLQGRGGGGRATPKETTMSTEALPNQPTRRGGVPRGIARTGPAILAYGFRPFFLAAGLFAIAVMALWIGALTLGWPIGGRYGPIAWHGHEMLFCYVPAALAGFMLTAIPNWTGRLPVSGRPLLMLVAV